MQTRPQECHWWLPVRPEIQIVCLGWPIDLNKRDRRKTSFDPLQMENCCRANLDQSELRPTLLLAYPTPPTFPVCSSNASLRLKLVAHKCSRHRKTLPANEFLAEAIS